jgi:hypothetical protein
MCAAPVHVVSVTQLRLTPLEHVVSVSQLRLIVAALEHVVSVSQLRLIVAALFHRGHLCVTQILTSRPPRTARDATAVVVRHDREVVPGICTCCIICNPRRDVASALVPILFGSLLQSHNLLDGDGVLERPCSGVVASVVGLRAPCLMHQRRRERRLPPRIIRKVKVTTD